MSAPLELDHFIDEAIELINSWMPITDPRHTVAVSSATVWEVEIKRAVGTLRAPSGFAALCLERGFDELPISFEHAERAGSLPPHHTDPFDRMLIAQAQLEGYELVTADRVFGAYDVRVMLPDGS